jgi:hypothetical protein
LRKTALIACLLTTIPLGAGALAAAPVSAAPSATTVGVSAGYSIFGDSDAALARDLDTAKAAGVTWLRMDIDWSSIQGSGSGSFDWFNTDRVVNAARARGMEVDGIVDYTPGWASTGGGIHPVPRDNNEFATFAGQAAARYAGAISTWEVWNEPNLQTFWGDGASAAAYTALLKATYPKIKAAAPNTTVLSGGLAPATTGGGDIAPESFVAQIYAYGGRNFLDAVAVHPYSYPALPSDASTASWNTAQKLTGIHNTMVNNGDGVKKVWLTEFGAPTGLGAPSVSEQQQANIIAYGLSYFASLGFTGPVFVYNIRDTRTGSTDPEQNFGLVRTDWSAKPAYTTVQQRANPTPPVVTPPVVTDWWAWLLGLLRQWFNF